MGVASRGKHAFAPGRETAGVVDELAEDEVLLLERGGDGVDWTARDHGLHPFQGGGGRGDVVAGFVVEEDEYEGEGFVEEGGFSVDDAEGDGRGPTGVLEGEGGVTDIETVTDRHEGLAGVRVDVFAGFAAATGGGGFRGEGLAGGGTFREFSAHWALSRLEVSGWGLGGLPAGEV